jgi:hypothetical protein
MPDLSDYFTYDDFRAITGDTGSPFKYEEPDIDRAQAEVIDRVERWSKSSWKARERVETQRVILPLMMTQRLPIVEVVSIHLERTDTDLTLDDVDIDPLSGVIRWGDWSDRKPLFDGGYQRFTITYTFGFDEDPIPAGVMRPCIQAASTLLDGEEKRSKIPRNTTKYSAERTDISLGRRGSVPPFPWDPRATDDLRAYWDPNRPRTHIHSVLN